MRYLHDLGHFVLFIRGLFLKPEKMEVYRRQIRLETVKMGIGSIGIVSIISIFLGAVISIQTSHNLFNRFVPVYVVAVVTRDSILIEFAPTIISLILSGKIGSSIASELGTMRVTEQIDALEIMGINASGYLVLPKIIAALVVVPFMIFTSIFLGISGGWIGGVLAGVITSDEFQRGLHTNFVPFNVAFAFIKSIFFAIIITTISAYQGFYTYGGALNVGRSSTLAVVYSSITILIADYVLTGLLLT